MPTDLEMPTQDELRTLRDKARHIRLETIRLIEIAKVGHYSSVFSCAEIFAALYYGVMRLRPGEPAWPDRDRFLMGRGMSPSACSRCWPTRISFRAHGWMTTPAWAARWATIPT